MLPAAFSDVRLRSRRDANTHHAPRSFDSSPTTSLKSTCSLTRSPRPPPPEEAKNGRQTRNLGNSLDRWHSTIALWPEQIRLARQEPGRRSAQLQERREGT